MPPTATVITHHQVIIPKNLIWVALHREVGAMGEEVEAGTTIHLAVMRNLKVSVASQDHAHPHITQKDLVAHSHLQGVEVIDAEEVHQIKAIL